MAPKKNFDDVPGTFEKSFSQLQEAKEISKEKSNVIEISINDITDPKFHDRTIYTESSIEELKSSIEDFAKEGIGFFGTGLLTPIIVRKLSDGKLERIAGFRRQKAFQLLNKKTIPAVIVDVSDRIAQLIMLIENIQRENLCAYDEVNSLLMLIATSCNMSIDDVKSQLHRFKNYSLGNIQSLSAEEIVLRDEMDKIIETTNKVSYSLNTLISKLNILGYHPLLIEALKAGSIKERIARVINRIKDDEVIQRVIDQVIENDLSLKQVEVLVGNIVGKPKIANGAKGYNITIKRVGKIDLLPEDSQDKQEAINLLEQLDSVLKRIEESTQKKNITYS